MTNPRERFFADPEEFFNAYSINLPGQPREAGKLGTMDLYQFKPMERHEDAHRLETAIDFKAPVHSFKRSHGTVHVSCLSHRAAWRVDDAAGKATLVVRRSTEFDERSMVDDLSGLKWFLCIMLPWVQNNVSTMQFRAESRADAFFTGTMNGCSFVVSGDPRAPFVSHINCDIKTEYPTRTGEMLDSWGVDPHGGARLGREHYKLRSHEIETREDQIRRSLRQQDHRFFTGEGGGSGSDIVTDSLCFVMGRRVEGNWEFFYQRVVTHQYAHYKKRGFFGRFGGGEPEVTHSIVYRSIQPYVRLWPGGDERLDL